jgi:disulfide bond formation protein DsbB
MCATIALVLVGSLFFQFVLKELPCPLCMLQRLCFLGLLYGLLLNLRFGLKPSHYAIALFCSTLGFAIGLRQILLHNFEPPGSGYGSAILGMHLYGWAALFFILTTYTLITMLLFEGQFSISIYSQSEISLPLKNSQKIILLTVIILALLNTVTTFAQCGPERCVDSPTHYWIFSPSTPTS